MLVTSKINMKDSYHHLFSKPLEGKVICHNDQERSIVMNLLALSIASSSVKLLAFALMSNHFHFLLEGRKEACIAFFDTFRCNLRRASYQISGSSLITGMQTGMVDIEDKWQFQNELAYIVRNPFVAMKDVNPLAYPWCSGYLYFNNMLDLSGEPLCALGTRKLRAFCCSRYPEIPQTSILVRDGMAIPATFTDYGKAMSFFDDARQFIMCVFKNVEAQVEIAHRMGEKPFLNDDELYGTVIRQSRLLFQTGKIQDLSDQQKMRLAHRLKAYYQCSNAQVARVLYLPIQTVNDLFPLAAKP